MAMLSLIILSFLVPFSQSFTMSKSILRSSNRLSLSMRWGLEGPKANKITGELPEGVTLRDTVPFELRGFSLPLVVFSVGVILTGTSLAGFFLTDGGGDSAISSLGFVYGIPVFLIGLSLWYAEIPPVPIISDEAGDATWEEKATDTFRKVKADVTRHRYGDDAHLDSTLEALGLKLPQKKYPKLQSLRQTRTQDGELAFTLTFQSAETPYKLWTEPQRLKKYETFFGPNISAKVEKVDAEKRLLSLTLTTLSASQISAAESVVAPTTSTDASVTAGGNTKADDF